MQRKKLLFQLQLVKQKNVTETENFAKQSCQVYLKGDKNAFRVMLLQLQCCARQS